jgi:hypothetical protein
MQVTVAGVVAAGLLSLLVLGPKRWGEILLSELFVRRAHGGSLIEPHAGHRRCGRRTL